MIKILVPNLSLTSIVNRFHFIRKYLNIILFHAKMFSKEKRDQRHQNEALTVIEDV